MKLSVFNGASVCCVGQLDRVFQYLQKVLLNNAVPGYFQFGFDAETVVAI